MGPSQGSWTASESDAGALALGGRPKDPRADRVLSWDGHVTGLIFGLTFFGCPERVIQRAFRYFGFIGSLQEIELFVQQYKFGPYDQVRALVDGPAFITAQLPSGVEKTYVIDYVDGRPTVLTHKYELLKALVPFCTPMLSSTDGRKITVEFTEGQLQICALDQSELLTPYKDNDYNHFLHVSIEENNATRKRGIDDELEEQLELEDDDQEEFEVESIRDGFYYAKELEDGRPPGLYYLIHWTGFPDSDDTWEPYAAIKHLDGLVVSFHKDNPGNLASNSQVINGFKGSKGTPARPGRSKGRRQSASTDDSVAARVVQRRQTKVAARKAAAKQKP